MLKRIAWGLLALPALALATPASAQGYAFPVDIRSQPLSSALRDLARQTGAELLFDRDLVRGMQAPRIKNRLTVEASLRQLLSGTDLTMRRASSGAWVIERRRAAPAPAPAPARTFIDLPTPEILVTAKRSQNADIQRRENDVQPYQVTTQQELVSAHRDNLDQFFRSRVTGNTQVLPNNLQDGGETNSQIDLRGLGIEGTMILVDGRRMPRVPDSGTGNGQPDINAIPLHAIERVETLTGTAGGIHGFGALGGVVNVILKRDYRGVELHATGGISSRGDAERLSLEGRVGFTPDDGRTDVMIELGWSTERPLLVRQRDYTLKNRRRSFELVPDNVLLFNANLDGVLAASAFSPDPLTLKPEYGGATLSNNYAVLASGFNGDPNALAAALVQHLEASDFTLTANEADSQMGSNAQTFSAIASIRHDFGGGIEGYFDGLYLHNRGRNFADASFATITMSPDVPQNPFTDYIDVTFPYLPADFEARTTYESMRLTAGAIVPLPADWIGTAEATFGRALYDRPSGTAHYYVGDIFLFGFPGEDPELTPLGNWDDFTRTVARYDSYSFGRTRGRNIYDEQSLRLAGPLLDLGGGPIALTLLAQHRHERTPRYQYLLLNERSDMTGEDRSARTIEEESLYAELRAPIFDPEAAIPLLRGLEFQFAARHDRQRFDFTTDVFDPDPSEIFRNTFSGTALTFGAKVSPLPWLMLRGSYATGVQPPSYDLLVPLEIPSDLFILLDPKRGNAWFTDDGPYLEIANGNQNLELIKAKTLSMGAVLNPFGDGGPRFSIDFSRVDKTGEPVILYPETILANEDLWPDRVIREPLTDADRALGYTGGRVQVLDWSAMNAGDVRIDTLDGVLEWTLPLFEGALRAYGAATLQLSNKESEPFAVPNQRVGERGGPLKWRVNGGIDWNRGSVTVGANLQFFSRYLVTQRASEEFSTAPQIQGSRWVKSQAYLDLYASRRFRIGAADASVDLGIVNVLDQSAPREINFVSAGAQYSMYGDPRGRRFELVLSVEF